MLKPWMVAFLALLFISGCQEKPTVNYDKALELISQLDPNEASKLTSTLFSIQQKRELEEIKVQAEALTYSNQESWKLKLEIGMGIFGAVFVVGFFIKSLREILICISVSGFLGCFLAWGLVIAGLEYSRQIGLGVVIFSVLIIVIILIFFIWGLIKNRDKFWTSFVEVVKTVQLVKKVDPEVTKTLKNLKYEGKLPQSAETEKLVEVVQNGGKK